MKLNSFLNKLVKNNSNIKIVNNHWIIFDDMASELPKNNRLSQYKIREIVFYERSLVIIVDSVKNEVV